MCWSLTFTIAGSRFWLRSHLIYRYTSGLNQSTISRKIEKWPLGKIYLRNPIYKPWSLQKLSNFSTELSLSFEFASPDPLIGFMSESCWDISTVSETERAISTLKTMPLNTSEPLQNRVWTSILKCDTRTGVEHQGRWCWCLEKACHGNPTPRRDRFIMSTCDSASGDYWSTWWLEWVKGWGC